MPVLNNDRKLTIFICTIAIIFAFVVKIAPVYYFKKGTNFLEKRNYPKAYVNLKKAHFFNPKDKDYRYYFVNALIKLEPTEQIQKELFDIASNGQNDSAAQLAYSRINEWKKQITNNSGDNYIEQAPFDQGIIRWNPKTFPLKIMIVDNSGGSIPDYYKTEILKAFAQWQTSTKFLKFAVTNDIQNADIIVKFEPIPNDLCSGGSCKYVVGFTNPTIKGLKLELMTITLYDNDPRGNFFSDKELYNTILHEIGHALGIMGHSYSSEDLMYMSTDGNNFYAPYRSSFQYLSTKDINTINILYSLIPTITNTPISELETKGLIYAPIILGTSKEISSRKLKEAQAYIKKAPELSGGYLDLAIAYAELEKYNDALKTLKKAFELSKTNSEKYIVLYNIAAINMNMGELDTALKYAKEAESISDSEEIKELLGNINHAIKSSAKPFKNNLMNID